MSQVMDAELKLCTCVLYLWSRAVEETGADSCLTRPEIHTIFHELAADLDGLGVIVLFDTGPGYPFSLQLERALIESMPYGIEAHPKACLFSYLLTLRRAKTHLRVLKPEISAQDHAVLETLVPKLVNLLSTPASSAA